MNSLEQSLLAAVERELKAAVERAFEPVLRRLGSFEARLGKIEELLGDIARAIQTRERIIQGWAAIGAELGCSDRHARRLGRLPPHEDPLPHYMQRGAVLAIASELKAWQVRQTRSGRRVTGA